MAQLIVVTVYEQTCRLCTFRVTYCSGGKIRNPAEIYLMRPFALATRARAPTTAPIAS